MKHILLLVFTLLIAMMSGAQTAGALYQYIGMSKSDISKKITALEHMRDWGRGSSLTVDETEGDGVAMLSFSFNEDDICIGAQYLKFNDDPEKFERFDNELAAISSDGWQLHRGWEGEKFYNRRFRKGNQWFYTDNTPHLFNIGLPESRSDWDPLPEDVVEEKPKPAARMSAEETERVINSYGGMTMEIIQRDSETFIGKLIAGKIDFKVGVLGEVNTVSASSSFMMKIRLGDVEVIAINGTEVTFKVHDQMEMTIDGENVDMFKFDKEVHFSTSAGSESSSDNSGSGSGSSGGDK
ncbi:MAG: hypothetical protein QNK23_08345 [Crocinitomicaceae bacterium]|nr:hypothetical protein [Crocinitomicaceae bacterium]